MNAHIQDTHEKTQARIGRIIGWVINAKVEMIMRLIGVGVQRNAS